MGVGGLFYPPILAMQAAMPIKDMATSTATVGLLRQLGSTVGVSVGQAIWASVSVINSLGVSLTKKYTGAPPSVDYKPYRPRHQDIQLEPGRQYQTTQRSAGTCGCPL